MFGRLENTDRSNMMTQWAWLDIAAPIVVQLPYHPCLYELLTDTPVQGAAAVPTLAGHGASR